MVMSSSGTPIESTACGSKVGMVRIGAVTVRDRPAVVAEPVSAVTTAPATSASTTAYRSAKRRAATKATTTVPATSGARVTAALPAMANGRSMPASSADVMAPGTTAMIFPNHPVTPSTVAARLARRKAPTASEKR